MSVYESVVGMAGGEAAMFFVKIPYRVETGEAERIAVDHTSKAAMGSGSEESSCECKASVISTKLVMGSRN